jgi:[ribosomal protein S5]-alanine N-acetyltransferase
MSFKPIATERLILRPLEARDRARLIKLANNWKVARNLSKMPYPYTEAAADWWLGQQEVLWASGQSVALAVTIADELIGGIGVSVRDDRRDGEWELGYWLGEPYWNRGYASEAATAVRDYAFGALKLERIVAGHYAENHASGRILSKLGFRYTCEAMRHSLARGADVKCLEMALPRERWVGMTTSTLQAASAG